MATLPVKTCGLEGGLQRQFCSLRPFGAPLYYTVHPFTLIQGLVWYRKHHTDGDCHAMAPGNSCGCWWFQDGNPVLTWSVFQLWMCRSCSELRFSCSEHAAGYAFPLIIVRGIDNCPLLGGWQIQKSFRSKGDTASPDIFLPSWCSTTNTAFFILFSTVSHHILPTRKWKVL